MKEYCYAKLNLSLNVSQRRDDGYHELQTIMVPIDLSDELTITIAEEDEYTSNRPYLHFDERNTIVKAIELMKERYHIKDHHHVHLKKFIPIRAGLAGGSSDAAGVIRIFDKMYDLKLAVETMNELALKIGADVCFCLAKRPALVEGIGEKITYFDFDLPYKILLVKPKSGLSTAKVYRHLDLNQCDHPDVYALKEALVSGDINEVFPHMANALEAPAMTLCPIIHDLKQELTLMGFDKVLMSGSGSTVFALTKDEDLIKRTVNLMRLRHYFACETKILKG